MADAARKRMTTEDFLAWQAGERDRYEFIDGAPRAMTGASLRHDTITVNVLRELSIALKGRRCRPATADVAVRLPSGNIRRPDALVECSDRFDGTIAHEPAAIVEVLSPSTRVIDQTAKFVDYQALPALRFYVLLQQDRPEATLYRRGDDGVWSIEIVTGLAGAVALDTLGVTLAMAELYDRLSFEAPAAEAGDGGVSATN